MRKHSRGALVSIVIYLTSAPLSFKIMANEIRYNTTMKKTYRKPPTYHFTPEGLEKLKQEQQQLLTERPDAVEHLRRAREMGDLSENGYYKASKFKLISIDNRLRHLAQLIKYTHLIQATDNNTISLGNTITISDGKNQTEYMLVGAFESNPTEGKISNASPLGRALLGKKVGETVEIQTLRGKTTYKILAIQ